MKVGSRVQCLVTELDLEAGIFAAKWVRQIEIEQVGFVIRPVFGGDRWTLCCTGERMINGVHGGRQQRFSSRERAAAAVF
ncbi:hypothetical protein F0562_034552 [Nyssa sinensis]|uniref:Uncharacterized protein n=1 Tax=Nyssa sinensis TaxID=561372 RepID=A0A5J5AIP0_9ASTE|nr:hypothetical protein F0562_034552 [Nyssa sinensis]